MDNEKQRLLQLQYEKAKDERERIDALVEIALEERTIDIERASEMTDRIIERSKNANYRKGLGRGLNLKGWCYWQIGNYNAGLEILTRAHTIARELKDKPLEARILNNFGYIYRDKGELSTALNYFENALHINEKLGDEVTQAVNLASIAYLNYDLADYDSALEFALRCLPIFKKANDLQQLGALYHILGNIYFKRDSLEEAYNYFEENLRQTESDRVMYALALNGIGKVYYKKLETDKAADYLQRALELSETVNNVEVQISCHYYLGRIYLDQNDYVKALEYIDRALKLARQYTRRHDIMSIHETLATLYDKMGDIPKAYHHLKTFEQMKEDIFTQAIFNKIRNLQTRQQLELTQKEKEVAERTADLKQQFMANMSHEIRTPMNAIVGITRLLLSNNPKEEQMRYLSAIQQSADNLLVIVNDILDLSKIEAGKIVLEHTPFSLREIMQSMHDMLMLKAEEKKLDFRVNIHSTIPPKLVGDPTRINQIIINLVGNAIKFTDKGYVEVRATLYKIEESKAYIQFDITDTGIGIAQDYMDRIFDSFTQAGTDITRRFGGTGLGLTICKQLATLMHGDITVTSKVGEGTTFTVIIPLDISTSAHTTTKEKVVDDKMMQRLNKIKVLLVEDNEFNRMVAEDTLKEIIPGIVIDIAVNGLEAVTRVEEGKYTLVLMDIQMPVMDGVTATRKIRNLPKPASDVKIIAMTANVFQEDVQQYLSAGMDAYVSKPFQPDELLLKMASVIENESPGELKNSGGNGEMQHITPFQPIPQKVTNMQFLKQFTGGDDGKVKKYVGMFLENAPKLLTNAEKALQAKDFQALKIAAHSLKPQLSYMGVKEEISHIFLIEQTASEAHHDGLPQMMRQLRKICEKAFEELKDIN